MMTRRQLLQSSLGMACLPLLSSAAGAIKTHADFIGVWLSPDWYFPGPRRYSEAEVRSIAQRVLRGVAAAGVNAVFLETFLRGYSIAPGVEASRYKVAQVAYEPGRQGIPVYPHLAWNYRIEVDTVVDPLEIFIEEGARLGIEIHAWMHLFYWKMDNPTAMLAWHSAPSLWSQMLVEYLDKEAARLSNGMSAILRAAADLLRSTTDSIALAKLLRQNGIDDQGSPLGVLLRDALRAGAARPDFLLLRDARDPFPASRGKMLRPIYLNPANPAVQERILYVVESLVKGHPNLAGIHLDHVRYPVDGQGLPEDLLIKDGKYNFYNQADSAEVARFQSCSEQLGLRREVLRGLVDKIRGKIPATRRLSAAVLPSYYHERDNGRFRLGGFDFSSQDWVGWKVDFVVPMLYEMNPYFIRTLLDLFTVEQDKRLGGQKITVYPGVSQMRLGRTGELSAPGWVFFDLKQARDVKLEKKEQTEDMNFGPQ